MDDKQENFNIKEINRQELANFKFNRPDEKPKSRKKYFQIGLIVVIVIILIVAAVIFFKSWFSFSKAKVELEVIAPTEIASGEEVLFTVRYQNNNRVVLKDAKLIIDYPQGTYSIEGKELTQETIELEDILAKRRGSKDFKIRLTGEKDSAKSLTVRLSYRPENIGSRFENSATFKINITSVLLGLYLTAPQKAVSGEEVSYALDYMNNSEEDFPNLKIEIDYPSGFYFTSAQPEPDEENNIWQIQGLKKNERGTIRISGSLEGREGENKTLTARIVKEENGKFLKYSQTDAITQISAAPLQISLFLNNKEGERNVNSKERLSYKIKFTNNTDIALSQLVLKAYLQGEMFDFKTLSLSEKGFFDSLNNIVTWSAAGVSSLALLPPGESGEVQFTVYLKKDFSITDSNDKNFQASMRAELETLNVPPQFNIDKLKIEKTLNSKINTNIVLQAKGYHNETTANISNFGPIPPQVNKTTAYTIHWQITNASNDLENVKVTTVLPQGIEWKNVYTSLGEGAQLEYNERTKLIVWKINRIPAATGFLIPVSELVFQVAITPSITQVGTTPVLIDESKLEAKDIFTGEILEVFDTAIATDIPDDPSVGSGMGRVEQ